MPDNILICQLWSLEESGRPTAEGEFCSLHIDEPSLTEFMRQYWARMPADVPVTYGCPTRDARGRKTQPYRCLVDAATYKRVRDSDIGMWSTTVPQQTTHAVSLISGKDLTSLIEGLS